MKYFFIILLSLFASSEPLWAQEDVRQRLYSHLYQQGLQHRMSGEYSQAMYLFRQAHQVCPSLPDALYEMGILNIAVPGSDSIAMRMIRQAAGTQPVNPYYVETAARVALHNNDEALATHYLEQLIRQMPTRSDILEMLCQLYTQQNKPEEAISALNRIEILEGTSTELSMKKFVLYKSMKKTKKAFNEMERLRRDNPHDIQIPLILGRMYMDEGKTKQAARLYDEVRRSNPNYTPLHLALIHYHRQQGQEAVADAIRDSLILAPDVDTNTRMQLTYERMEELRQSPDSLQGAMRFFRTIVSRYPTPEMHALGAYYLIDNNAPEESIVASLRQLLQVNPADERALSLLLGHYFPRQDFENAAEVCRMGMNAHPEKIQYSFYLGAILSMNGERQEAVDILKNGLLLAEENTRPEAISESYSLMGDCYHQMDQEALAFAAYDSALVHNPSNTSCLNNYAYYLSLNKQQMDKAEQMAYRAIQLEPLNKTFLDTYAWVLHVSGNTSMARFYISRVISPSLSDEDILADETISAEVVQHAADIYAADNKPEEAGRYAQLALQKKNKETAEKKANEE